ncbi:MAG: hypothetical protein JKY52_06275 [Flavobacteriales bacterium]|nr:hypothetical protein [Flavobacteriales bacterium]
MIWKATLFSMFIIFYSCNVPAQEKQDSVRPRKMHLVEFDINTFQVQVILTYFNEHDTGHTSVKGKNIKKSPYSLGEFYVRTIIEKQIDKMAIVSYVGLYLFGVSRSHNNSRVYFFKYGDKAVVINGLTEEQYHSEAEKFVGEYDDLFNNEELEYIKNTLTDY